MLCSACNERKVFSRGLCQTCYWRQRRTGSFTRKNAQNQGLKCSVDGCEKAAHAKGFCYTHYEDSRHPMMHLWSQLRSRNVDGYPFSWNRFEAFLSDVGERPTPSHQLRKIRIDQPFSKDNFHWVEPVGKNRSSYSPEEQAAYGREWHLQRKFRITGEDYAALLVAQGGGCAVCGGKETHVHPSGKPKDLAVDHDHDSDQVRGLLCFNCNQGIGRLKDSPALLRAAAAYLERHQPTLIEDAAE